MKSKLLPSAGCAESLLIAYESSGWSPALEAKFNV